MLELDGDPLIDGGGGRLHEAGQAPRPSLAAKASSARHVHPRLVRLGVDRSPVLPPARRTRGWEGEGSKAGRKEDARNIENRTPGNGP